MLSQKTKYAVKAMIALADIGVGEAMQIAELAQQEAIPKKFLEQILLDLKHHGLINSRRGKHGGYTLIKNPEEISIGRIVRLIEGPIAPLSCLSKMAYQPCEDCKDEKSCRVRRVFASSYQATVAALESTTLQDALGPDLGQKTPVVA
ncbi:RrF2 family transcriptional regulator [Thalassospira xiamenensis]|uniref:Transcriptional regulator, BadM/Rrf2 family n=1 Tax=Thalassospira xiamenensis TaxID=220697 RepID=A0A285T8I5_9PROT|nr:Rrf2 family transcriptional regulator [Thalassospira xiamenensis]SOC17687.1 transcriptional regulator, BadM/Rrf2 family [Thalassospira xiamenensis]